jgi:hypothetical protein
LDINARHHNMQDPPTKGQKLCWSPGSLIRELRDYGRQFLWVF